MHQKVFWGIEDNKPLAIEKLKAVSKEYSNVEVVVVKTKYPQGDQKRLICYNGDSCTVRASTSAVGIRVINANTAIAISDAVLNGKPLMKN